MPDNYRVKSTSAWTAEVEDIWLNPPEDPDSALTRRILRAELVENSKDPDAGVRACLMHQRRPSKKEPWEDVDSFNLAHLKGGEEVRLQLGAGETLDLFRQLARLHTLAERGIPKGEEELVIGRRSETIHATGRAQQVIRALLDNGGDEIWTALAEIQPDLFKAVLVNKLHQVREAAVNVFDEQLAREEWSEDDWQEFFEDNTWIFGYGLSYRFLTTLQTQPHYGGTSVTGRGAQRGDFLAASEAEKKFTVLVEIKTPAAALVGKEYRNGAHIIGGHVAGGVAQLQTNCRMWESTAREPHNQELIDSYTVQPKGILVIGHTSQLETSAQRNSFELFRRNTMNPEIITFDELLERSRHLLLNEKRRIADARTEADDDDDLPF